MPWAKARPQRGQNVPCPAGIAGRTAASRTPRRRARGRRRLRLDEFDHVEEALAPALETVEREGWSIELSPVIRTRDEAEGFSILYLDMTVDVRILFDREEFLRRRLDRMRAELQRLGAQRRTLGTRWYWVLKKDYRPGEVFEIS
jgi:hypothetical protein